MHSIDTVVFDKTGTLTSGKPKVTASISVNKQFKVEQAMSNLQLLYEAALLAEKTSEHPIAKAICGEMESKLTSRSGLELLSFTNRNGEGIVARLKDGDKEL